MSVLSVPQYNVRVFITCYVSVELQRIAVKIIINLQPAFLLSTQRFLQEFKTVFQPPTHQECHKRFSVFLSLFWIVSV